MKSSWLALLDAQVAKDVKSNFVASLLTRKRLAKLLTDKIDTSNKVARAKAAYDCPNWALLQADQRGYERALYEVIDLILENDKEKDTPQ